MSMKFPSIRYNQMQFPILNKSLYESVLYVARNVLDIHRESQEKSPFQAYECKEALKWFAEITTPRAEALMLERVKRGRQVSRDNWADKAGRAERNAAWLEAHGYHVELDVYGHPTGRLTAVQLQEMRAERMKANRERARVTPRGPAIPSLSPQRRYSLVQVGKIIKGWESWARLDAIARVLYWIDANEQALKAAGMNGLNRVLNGGVDIPYPPGSPEYIAAKLRREALDGLAPPPNPLERGCRAFAPPFRSPADETAGFPDEHFEGLIDGKA